MPSVLGILGEIHRPPYFRKAAVICDPYKHNVRQYSQYMKSFPVRSVRSARSDLPILTTTIRKFTGLTTTICLPYNHKPELAASYNQNS